MTSRREREKLARRAAILEAAEALVEQTGGWSISMGDVAKAVELSKGTLYLYFENKDALCAAIATRAMKAFRPQLDAEIATAGSGLADWSARSGPTCAGSRRNHICSAS